MNWPVFIDASALKDWECREFFRQRHVLKRTPAEPNLNYEYGKIVHFGVELFWKGSTFEEAMTKCYELCNQVPTDLISRNVYKSNKWKDLQEQLPDLLSVYWDSVEQEPSRIATWHDETLLECEWSVPYCMICKKAECVTRNKTPFGYQQLSCTHTHYVTLCGRIDRVLKGNHGIELPDVKTASEIASQGIPWKQGYQKGKMLEVQFGLYDWYLGHLGIAPVRVYLEVLLKGYKSRPCRYEVIELPYVTTEAYRERFKQQLAWKVSEIVNYFQNKTEQSPWPMSQQLCQSKYGECPYLEGCLNGWTDKTLEHYTERLVHLEVMK